VVLFYDQPETLRFRSEYGAHHVSFDHPGSVFLLQVLQPREEGGSFPGKTGMDEEQEIVIPPNLKTFDARHLLVRKSYYQPTLAAKEA
jgi:hypothetical protein